MSTDLMNVSAFKGIAPAQAFQVLDPHAESLADGIGSSYGIVGYKGKVWSLRLRGETHMFVRPDDGSPAAFLDVIVLRSPPYKSKSYYPAGTFQDGNVGQRPLCAALDGVTPDADIATPQSNACAVCPRNIFKMNADGKKTRECSDYKRLSVLILPSMTKALLGAPLMEPVFLRVPAASLNDLAMLGEAMSAQGFHYSSYITRIGFNPEKPHPQMTFRALQPLSDKEAPVVLPLREDATALRITGENEVGKPRPALTVIQGGQAQPQVQAQAQPQPQVVTVQPVAQQPVQQVQPPVVQARPVVQAPVDTGFGDVSGAGLQQTLVQPTVQPQVVQPQVQPATVDTGFGDIGGGTVQMTQPGTQGTTLNVNTVSDTGAPEDADADLDARVMALLPK